MAVWLKFKYQILLVLLLGLVFLTNFDPGTFLLGWDNFNSEFSPFLAVKQALNAGWSDFRSFGLAAGMGYATDLWHALFVWASSFVLPINSIRYIFHLILWGTGGLGVFYLFGFFGLAPIFSFLGSLYYLFNFGTIQIFGLPYEPFSTFFAFLPWAVLFWLKLLKEGNRKNLIWFLLVNLLLSGAFYVQTLFVVYFLLLAIMVLVDFLTKAPINFRKISKLFLLILLVNTYWLLTQAYFLTGPVGNVTQAKQTLLGWRTPYYQNKAHGSFWDFFTQKGYYSEFEATEGKLVFQPWLDHFGKWPVESVQVVLVSLIILGILEGKNKYKKYFLGFLGLQVLALLMTWPGVGQVNQLLRVWGVIDQIFRSPFSKFTMSQGLVLAYFLVLGAKKIFRLLGASGRLWLVGISCAGLIFYSWPVWTGNFFAQSMKVKLPGEYQQLFTFFDKVNKTSRIGLLPEVNIWGWYVYDWGYLGSGFLWHGISQPIVSRSYDVWSRDSENYFWELSQALTGEDDQALKKVLAKYQIAYLLIDDSLATYASKNLYLQRERTREILQNSNWAKIAFKAGKLEVYRIKDNDVSLFTINNLPNIGPKANVISLDTVFATHGFYQTDETRDFAYFYPFLDLQSFSLDSQKAWEINEVEGSFEIVRELPESLSQIALKINTEEEFFLPGENNYKQIRLPVSFEQKKNQLTVKFPKIKVDLSNLTNPENCGDKKAYLPNRDIFTLFTSGGLDLTFKNGAQVCWGYHYDQISQKYSYLLKIDQTNIQGMPLLVSVLDHTKKQNLLEVQLGQKADKFLIVPQGSEGSLGMSVNFQSFSYKNTDSENILKDVSLYLFPQEAFKTAVFAPLDEARADSVTQPVSYEKIAPWLYKATIKSNEVLILSQAYDLGWLAWTGKPFVGQKLKQVLVNNWENGWVLRQGSVPQGQTTIYIFFWPQVLEYLGFGLLLGLGLWGVFHNEN